MKQYIIILTVIAGILTTGCKKEYICECTDLTQTLTAFRTKDTKRKAQQKCDNYYKQNYGNVTEATCKIR